MPCPNCNCAECELERIDGWHGVKLWRNAQNIAAAVETSIGWYAWTVNGGWIGPYDTVEAAQKVAQEATE